MKAQKPAEGVLMTNDWGHSKMYKITCNCGQPYHDHVVDVESDSTGVSVDIYTTLKTDYCTDTIDMRYDIENVAMQEAHWFVVGLINNTIRKLKLTWELWTTGAVTAETTIHMSEQQALNYAEVLKSAVKDVKVFQEEIRKKHNEQVKSS